MNQMATKVLRSGSHMPVLGLGTWELTHNTAETIAKAIASLSRNAQAQQRVI